MKLGLISGLAVAVLWGALAIAQLWWAPLDGPTFMKVSVTAAIVEAMIVVVTLALREYLSDKRLKEDGFLDG